MDTNYRRQQRQAASTDDPHQALTLLRQQARLSGCLIFLSDRQLWQQLDEAEQDAAIEAAKERLGEDFQWSSTEIFECGPEAHRIAIFKHQVSAIELALLPGSGAIAPFLMGLTPATIGQLGDPGHELADAPAHRMSWNDCQDCLKYWPGLRLPSVDEWQYACRAGSKTRFFWGQGFDPKYCWHLWNSITTPNRSPNNRSQVLRYSVEAHRDHCNAFGLSDILGAVWEWCDSPKADARGRKPMLGGDLSCERMDLIIDKVIQWRLPHRREEFSAHIKLIPSLFGFRVAADLPLAQESEAP